MATRFFAIRNLVRLAGATVSILGFSLSAYALTPQTITFPALANTPITSPPPTPAATASSGLPVSYASTTTGVCTISGSTISFVSAGTCSITASQAGNATYAAATPVTQSFNVTRGSNTIMFSSLPDRRLGSGTFNLSATASSGLPVVFASSTTQTCTIAGATVTLLTAGQCTIVASQAGNAAYAAAVPVSQSFSITKAATSVRLVSSSSSVLFHESVILTATVSGKSPTGNVTFTDGGTVLGVVAVNGSSQAILAASNLSVGSHSIIAVYGGDSNNLASTSSAVAVMITRPNPANDPDVRGLVTAQANAEVQFAQTQIENVIQRLESLHDDNTSCFTNSIGLNSSKTEGPGGASALSATLDPMPHDPSVVPTDRPTLNNGSSGCGGLNRSAFVAWTAGTINLGSANLLGSPQSPDNRFTTSGVTTGLDASISTDLKAGFAIGFGTNHTSVGTDGTSIGANGASGTAYASFHPSGSIYFDALSGYGATRFTSNRFSPLPGAFELGERMGSEIFGAIETTSEQRWDNWRFALHTRLQFIDAQLDAFSETGDPTWALSYANASMHEISGVVGLSTSYNFPTSWGALSPTFRAEYTRAFDYNLKQGLSYADTPGINYAFSVPGLGPNTFSGALGLTARYTAGASATLEYQFSTAGSFGKSQGLRASLDIPF